MATQMTKSQLIEQIATKIELAKKDVKGSNRSQSSAPFRSASTWRRSR
jgi:hypothetical protein